MARHRSTWRFGLKDKDARAIAAEVGAAVATWRDVAGAVGIRKAEIDRMASACEHDDLEQAIK